MTYPTHYRAAPVNTRNRKEILIKTTVYRQFSDQRLNTYNQRNDFTSLSNNQRLNKILYSNRSSLPNNSKEDKTLSFEKRKIYRPQIHIPKDDDKHSKSQQVKSRSKSYCMDPRPRLLCSKERLNTNYSEDHDFKVDRGKLDCPQRKKYDIVSPRFSRIQKRIQQSISSHIFNFSVDSSSPFKKQMSIQNSNSSQSVVVCRVNQRKLRKRKLRQESHSSQCIALRDHNLTTHIRKIKLNQSNREKSKQNSQRTTDDSSTHSRKQMRLLNSTDKKSSETFCVNNQLSSTKEKNKILNMRRFRTDSNSLLFGPDYVLGQAGVLRR